MAKPRTELQQQLISALEQTAVKLEKVDYTLENYNQLFARGYVETPIETLKLGENQFAKFGRADRNYLMAAAYQTLTTPGIVFNSESLDSKTNTVKPVRIYGKSFYQETLDKSRAVESVIVLKDEQSIVIGTHNKDYQDFVKQIKTADQIIFADSEISRVFDRYKNVASEHVRTADFTAQFLNPRYNVQNILSIGKLIDKGTLTTLQFRTRGNEHSPKAMHQHLISALEQTADEQLPQEVKNRSLAPEGDKTMSEEQKNAYITRDDATRIALSREIRANMPGLTDGERAAALAIMEAGAASMQMSLSDYVQNTFPNGVFGDFSTAQNAAHQRGVEINGAVSVRGFGDSVRATIYVGKTADFSTFVHELSHVWQAQLRGKLKNDAEKAFQVQNGDWKGSTYTFADGHTDTSAEAFAYGFEDFLKKKAGEMASEDKKAIFEKFADYMARTYNGTKEHIKISEDIAKVYEQFVQLDDNILAEAEKAVRMEKEFFYQSERDLYAIFKLDNDCDEKIEEVIKATDSGQNEKVEKELGKVSEAFVDLAARNGENLAGYTHSIDSYFIKHDRKRHGITKSEIEQGRGQVAVTDDDIRKIPAVLESPDYIVFGAKNRQHNNTVIYVKNMDDGSSLYVEEERTRSKHLAANTFYKMSAASNATSISRIPTLYAQNDRGTIKIIDVKKEIVNTKIPRVEALRPRAPSNSYDTTNSENVNNKIQFQSAYHGSGASFDRFNTAEYGFSGEGSMVFGWGTYLTSSEAIARSYAVRQGSDQNTIERLQKKYPDLSPYILPIWNNLSAGDSFAEAKKNYIDYLRENHTKGIREITRKINELNEDDFVKVKRNLYTVTIPDGNYLLWDKPVSDEIRTAVYKSIREQGSENFDFSMSFWSGRDKAFTSGEELYEAMKNATGGEEEASKFLHKAGITGISYPAGTIHGGGGDATNYVIFNDDDITIDEHLQFQVIGERGATNLDRAAESNERIANLDTARMMEEADRDEKTIKMATGWERGADGRWRYEIGDAPLHTASGLKLSGNTIDGKLEDLLDAPELYAAYPELKDYLIFAYNDVQAEGYENSEGKQIGLKESYLHYVSGESESEHEDRMKLEIEFHTTDDKERREELFYVLEHRRKRAAEESFYTLTEEGRNILLHEIQHAIQDIEGFAGGGNPGQFTTKDFSRENAKSPYEQYHSLSGEVEARNVQRRMGKTAAERRSSLLSETEDVPRSEQIMQFGKESASLFVPDEKEYETYQKQLDDYLAGNLKPSDFISLGKTPEVLERIGVNQNEVVIFQNVIDKSLRQPQTDENGKFVQGHEIDVSVLKKLPEYISNPLMVFKSDTVPNSKVIMTEYQDVNNRTVVVALHCDSKADSGKLEVNRIASVYRKDSDYFFLNQIRKGNLEYIDEKRSREWAVRQRLQLPPLTTILGYSSNLTTKEDFVNTSAQPHAHGDDSFSRSLQPKPRGTSFAKEFEHIQTKSQAAKAQTMTRGEHTHNPAAERRSRGRIVIDARNERNPARYMGEYLAAGELRAVFITDERTIDRIQKSLLDRLTPCMKDRTYLDVYRFGDEAAQWCMKVKQDIVRRREPYRAPEIDRMRQDVHEGMSM